MYIITNGSWSLEENEYFMIQHTTTSMWCQSRNYHCSNCTGAFSSNGCQTACCLTINYATTRICTTDASKMYIFIYKNITGLVLLSRITQYIHDSKEGKRDP